MINVVSLFDGMACGYAALVKAGLEPDNYCASEIDKYAIKVALKNWPKIRHIGDVTLVDVNNLGFIPDLLIGGSPCQGFSFAGKLLNFNDSRSALFFEYVRILKDLRRINPNVKFLLENVKMKKEWQRIISDILGVEPIEINSALMSAQNRTRLYWTNIEGVYQPENKGIRLKDITESNVDQKYYITEKWIDRLLFTNEIKKGFSALNPEKAICMTARQYANWKGTFVSDNDLVIGASIRGRRFDETGTRRDNDKNIKPQQRIELNDNPDKANNLSTVEKDNIILELKKELKIRRLTPAECERLQTLEDGYTEGVSDSQRYKMLGNGWTRDVIAHILSFYKEP